jgi:hypothetical protein
MRPFDAVCGYLRANAETHRSTEMPQTAAIAFNRPHSFGQKMTTRRWSEKPSVAEGQGEGHLVDDGRILREICPICCTLILSRFLQMAAISGVLPANAGNIAK